MLNRLKKELLKLKDPEKTEILQRFFKTGKGEYGEGDIFLGIKVWGLRDISKRFFNLNLNEIKELLNSKIHEHRLVGLLILTQKYNKLEDKEEIFNFYIDNILGVNNWDLVDLSAPNIVGDYLVDKDKEILYKLAKSKNLWKKRISIISTFAFIKENQFEDTLKISEILLKDKHDLIHKAVGWMLREIGKRNQGVEENFLKKHYKEMPRTMLRYAIEKFDEEKRKFYLKK